MTVKSWNILRTFFGLYQGQRQRALRQHGLPFLQSYVQHFLTSLRALSDPRRRKLCYRTRWVRRDCTRPLYSTNQVQDSTWCSGVTDSRLVRHQRTLWERTPPSRRYCTRQTAVERRPKWQLVCSAGTDGEVVRTCLDRVLGFSGSGSAWRTGSAPTNNWSEEIVSLIEALSSHTEKSHCARSERAEGACGHEGTPLWVL